GMAIIPEATRLATAKAAQPPIFLTPIRLLRLNVSRAAPVYQAPLRFPSVRLGPRCLSSVAKRFGDVNAADLLRAGQIGNRPRHPQHSRITARGQTHGFGRLEQ